MGKLIYRTRGGSSPQGKPKVYLSIHPADRGAYLEEFVSLLLELQDLSVWYPEDPETVRTGDLMDDLSQMQLFVMPVTTRLLTSEDPALTVDFPFAQTKHIPVLPIMMEQGLEALYEKRCGDLQFLDRNAKDDTTLSFREKLEQYLSSVLIGDELAEKIRGAFDAYVFLSYRKKDRKYAQELMRLVHKNDICRDIAIWYDEFLVPGEGFNDAIRGALEKSGLFLLAVTPNLVNEVNYVMTTEYPMAKEAGKPVLPAEMVPTDRDALEKGYPEIPLCTDARDDEAMYQALLAAVQKLAVRENDDSPEHNFFIGLAYLGGVDVEVDHHRALGMIRSAAEGGLPEAAEKLVQMYRTGHGVERDYMEAIRWQERVIEIREAGYCDTPDMYTLHDLFWAQILCGDYYEEQGKLAEAERHYARAMERGQASGYTDRLTQWDRNVGHSRLGDIAIACGDLQTAESHYRKGLEISLALAEEARTEEARRQLSISYNDLGDAARACGDLQTAEDWYRKSFEIRLALAEETRTVEARRDLGISYDRLGDMARACGDLETAQTHYRKGVEIRFALAEETQTVEARRDLSISYGRLGDIAHAHGDLQTAEGWYRKALAIDLVLAEEIQTVEARRGLGICYTRLGNIACARGDLETASDCYRKGLEIYLVLAEQTQTVGSRRDLSVSYNKLGDVARARGDLQTASDCYRKGLEIDLVLGERTQTVEARRGLSIGHIKLGDVALARGDLQTASVHYQKGHELMLGLAEQTQTVGSRRDLSVSYNKLGDAARARGDLQTASDCYRKSLELDLVLAEQTQTVEVRRGLGVSHDRLGDMARARGDLQTASVHYRKSLEIRLALAKETQSVEVRRDLTISYSRLGSTARARGDLQAASAYYQKRFELSKALVIETGTVESIDGLAVSHAELALVCPEKKQDHLREAVRLCRVLCDACPGVARYRKNLEMLQKALGDQ